MARREAREAPEAVLEAADTRLLCGKEELTKAKTLKEGEKQILEEGKTGMLTEETYGGKERGSNGRTGENRE